MNKHVVIILVHDSLMSGMGLTNLTIVLLPGAFEIFSTQALRCFESRFPYEVLIL